MAKTMIDSKLVFERNMTEGVKRAVRERLQIFLKDKENAFSSWSDNTRRRLNKTRQEAIERRFNKEIQALRIVIYMMTPYADRTEEEPQIVVKKSKAPKPVKGLLPASTTVLNPILAGLTNEQISTLAGLADLLKVKS